MNDAYLCERCRQPCEPDEEGVPRCRNQGCPWFMTIPDAFRH